MLVSSGKQTVKSDSSKARLRQLRRIRYLLRWMPSRKTLNRFPILGKFGRHLKNRKYLWSFQESSVAPAILIGSVIAFLPIFGIQLLTVMVIALILKVNLPVLAGLQFISNPLTLVPIYLANYKVGSWILGAAGVSMTGGTTSRTVVTGLNSTLVGGIVLGTIFGLCLYGVYLVRIKWNFLTSKVAL